MSVANRDVRAGLGALFLPESVAVIGATERQGAVGRTVLENLLHPSFRGKVFPVNSRHAEICGRKAYPSIGDIPEKVDLAVVATPLPRFPASSDNVWTPARSRQSSSPRGFAKEERKALNWNGRFRNNCIEAPCA